MSWKMRPKTICSFSVRMKRSATPLVSGSRTKAKLGVIPKKVSWFWKCSDSEAEERGFGWIDSYRIHRRDVRGGRKIMAAVEVNINDWMFRAIVKDRRILTIHRDYFGLKMALERRLYELARKHLGNQNVWTISLARLHQKCGAESHLRQFKVMVVKVAERGRLPDFHLDVVEGAAKPTRLAQTKVVFLRRACGDVRSIVDIDS